MNEKKIEPTQAMVDIVDLADKLMVMDTRDLLRTALNHPDAAGLLECDHTDYVHVDEAATRLAAAREEGWDDAVVHICNKGWEGVGALRNANPHRPAPPLPTKPGTVIVPADGHKYITATVGGETYRAREAILSWGGNWHAAWRSGDHTRIGVPPGDITPGTWKEADQ